MQRHWTASLHWRNKWTDSQCQLAYLEIRRIGSVQQYLSFKATKTLVSCLLLSLLALLGFSLIKLKARSAAQLASFSKLLTLPTLTPLLYGLRWSDLLWSALICFHIVAGTTPPYLSELSHLYSPSRSLRSASDIPCPWDGQEDPGGEILTSDLWSELSFSLCVAFVFTLLSQNWKSISSLLHIDLSFSSHLPTHHQECIYYL